MAWTVILGIVVWKCREDRTRGAEIVERRAGLRTRIGLNGIGRFRWDLSVGHGTDSVVL